MIGAWSFPSAKGETTMNHPMTVTLQTKQSIGRRRNQEDAAGCSAIEAYASRGLLCVVSDGMGGMARGEEYSQSAVHAVLTVFDALPAGLPPRQILLSCYAAARKAALALRTSPDDADGGATLIMAYIREGRCTTLSVGDSRICLLRGGGLIELTREQTLGAMLDERAALGVISGEIASNNLHRNSLLCNINADNPQLSDLYSAPFTLLPGDRLILMSDGVFGTLTEDELTHLLYTHADAADAILAAIEHKVRPHQDNCTVTIVDIR